MAANTQQGSPPLGDLLLEELKLARSQWEERAVSGPAKPRDGLENQYLEIDCLVHDDWLSGAVKGHLSPVQVPQVSQEEVHWLLQPSCDSILPRPWQRVHICCFRKADPGPHAQRMLVPQADGYSRESVHEFLTQVAQENLLQSWRETMLMVHKQPTKLPTQRPVTSAFVHQLVEQLYKTKVQQLCTGTTNNSDPKNSENANQNSNKSHSHTRRMHLNSFSENSTPSRSQEPEDGAHSNLAHLLAAVESKNAFYLIFPYQRFTLFDATVHSPAMFGDSVAKPLFVLYQLLQLLDHCHSKGITLGELGLKSIFVDTRLWVKVRPPPSVFCSREITNSDRNKALSSEKISGEECGQSLLAEPHSDGGQSSSLVAASSDALTLSPNKVSGTPLSSKASDSSPLLPDLSLSEATQKWRVGCLSNFDYLMILNLHAGRSMGDPNNHPIFPWVMDFTHPDGGYRDLSKSKHRLNKGDEQLDFTYLAAQEELRRAAPDQDTLVPHHISDISSDVTYYVYLARKTPKEVLCSRVRPRWVPEEYPASLEKMYIWTPDECIPEFFTDASLFRSIHPDLPDLALPGWCQSPEEMIALHRRVLEGDHVSSHLHHWIDLVFGYKLSGSDAVKAKNVYLSLVDKHKNPTNCGIVQLFKSSHPKRIQKSSTPYALFEWESYLNMSSLMNVTGFSIEQIRHPQSSAQERYQSPTPSSPKTLESILYQQTQKSSPRSDAEGPQGETGGENQDDDLEDSYEHVTLPPAAEEVKLRKGRTEKTEPSTAEIGINYGEAPAVSVANEKAIKGKGERQFRVPVVRPVVDYFRQRRSVNLNLDVESGYDWQQSGGISLPREAHILDPLIRLEELAGFVAKSCKDDGGLFQEQWDPEHLFKLNESKPPTIIDVLTRQEKNPAYYPSFEDRVGIDIVAVTCTVIEMCCWRQLRAAMPANPSLLQRVSTIRRLLKNGQLQIKSFLSTLADFILHPETATSLSPDDIHLPSLSSSLLLQTYLPIVAFPSYFETLFKFVSKLEQVCLECSLNFDCANLQRWVVQVLGYRSSSDAESIAKVIDLVSRNLTSLLDIINSEGFFLLLLHIYPFFQYQDTMFEAVYTFLDPLARRLSRKNAERLFSCVLIQLFDSATEPHQRAQLLSRTTADLILKRFSLKTFLERFLGFYIDAVIEPARTLSKISATKRHGSNIVRLQSQSSTLMASDILQSQAFEDVSRERERGRKTDFSFSLALSETAGPMDYDSDKDYSTDDSDNYDDDDDVGYSADMSLLVKTDMGHALSALPSISEATNGASSSLPLMSLMLGSQQENLAAGTGDGNLATKPWLEQGEGGASEENSRNVMEGGAFTELSMAAVDGVGGGGSTAATGGKLPKERIDSNVQTFESTTSTSSTAPQSQSQSQSHHTSATSPESPVRKGYSFSFNSVFSEDPNEAQAQVVTDSTTNVHPSTSTAAVPTEEQLSAIRGPTLSVGSGKRIPSQPEEPFASDDDEDEEEENADAESTSSMDPQTMAVNSYLSEVAADCVSWLMRRLGPFLATQHIAKPLVESLHRCFLGILNSKGRETSAVKCLSSYAEYYGETVVLRFYIPHAENLVNSAITRMSMKSEAGVAASLALIKLSIKALSPKTLEDGIANELSDHYFLPLIQLLSAQTTFPSGGKARAAICQTMVSLLVQLGEKLETRELASEVLMPTVKGFFACFSVVHETGSKMHTPAGQSPARSNDELRQNGLDRDENVSVTPTVDDPLGTRSGTHQSLKELDLMSRGVPTAKTVEQHPLTPQKEDLDVTPKLARHSRELKEEVLLGESETYRQVCATFSRPMAHSSYIQFCRLLGQYNLGDKLYNRELIEQIAYGHDETAQPKSPLPNVLTEPAPESDLSSESEDDSDGETLIEKRDAAIKVGPIIAVTGLGKDASGFGRSSWFVDLDEKEESARENITKEEESSAKASSTKGSLQQLLSGRSSSDGQPIKSNSLGRNVASFDAKFGAVPPVQPDGGVGVAGGRGHASSGSVSGVLSSGASSGHGSSSDEADHTLTQSWELIWETRLQRTVYARDSFSHFKGERLQTFSGHKGAIKCLASADGEHYFVSGSKDRTAKVWSVRNHGTSSNGSVGCRLTYSGHQKPVFAVELMENLDSVVSCDGSVHHWDAETGYCIHQFTSPRNIQYVAMTALPSPQPVVAMATTDLHLRFIDLRMKSYQQLWKLQYPTAGTTKVLTCAENWIAAGSNSGTVNSLDLRNGEFLCTWRPSEFPSAQQTWNESLHQIQSTPRGNLITSAGNGLLGLWKPAYGKLLHLLRGQSSVTQCLEVVGEQLISVSNGGCVVVHDCFENSLKSANPSSVRLRYLRGVSALAALPENHLLLLGSDNGNIALMA